MVTYTQFDYFVLSLQQLKDNNVLQFLSTRDAGSSFVTSFFFPRCGLVEAVLK